MSLMSANGFHSAWLLFELELEQLLSPCSAQRISFHCMRSEKEKNDANFYGLLNHIHFQLWLWFIRMSSLFHSSILFLRNDWKENQKSLVSNHFYSTTKWKWEIPFLLVCFFIPPILFFHFIFSADLSGLFQWDLVYCKPRFFKIWFAIEWEFYGLWLSVGSLLRCCS